MATKTTPNLTVLAARRAVLVQRLDDGDRRIDDARRIGASTDQWETFWLQLLDEYVDVSARLDAESNDALAIAA